MLAGRLVDNYRIRSLLGEGGCGSVWLAEHHVIGTKVAIKVLKPEISAMPGIHERFIMEARATAAIPGAHVARYLDLGKLATGESYAIIEYLDGETLGARIEREGALPVSDALSIAAAAAEGLAGAHDAGIVHRDIKPDNIFLGDTVKLLDFGIAKLLDVTHVRQTQTGMFIGTLMYAAPEQLVGTGVGVAADVYALGATLFEMLTGTMLFDGDPATVATKKLSETAPRVQSLRAEISASLDALVAAMLEREAAQRPVSVRHVARLLHAELAMLRESNAAGPGSVTLVPSPRASTGERNAPGVEPARPVTAERLAPSVQAPRAQRSWFVATAALCVAAVLVLLIVVAKSSSSPARVDRHGSGSSRVDGHTDPKPAPADAVAPTEPVTTHVPDASKSSVDSKRTAASVPNKANAGKTMTPAASKPVTEAKPSSIAPRAKAPTTNPDVIVADPFE